MESSELRLRVLCLHGYRQNSDVFSKKLGSLRKILKDYAEFVFIDAPHRVNSTNLQDTNSSNEEAKESSSAEVDESMRQQDGHQPKETSQFEEGNSGERSEVVVKSLKSPESAECDTNGVSTKLTSELSWWFNKEDRTFKGTNRNGPAYGFDQTIQVIEDAWKNLGPFQGILGFSQGACLVGLLCLLAKKNMTVVKPEFAIICSGFLSGSLAHHNFYDGISEVPSLHIFGISDEIITPKMSKALFGYFVDPEIVQHDGGHYFPATAAQKKFYREFFETRLEEHKTLIDLHKENDNQNT